MASSLAFFVLARRQDTIAAKPLILVGLRNFIGMARSA